MVTQRAELANLVTNLQGGTSGSKTGHTLTESFQTYIAGKNDMVSQSSDTMVQHQTKVSAESSQKETYDKVSTGVYSKNVNQVKDQLREANSVSGENTGNVQDAENVQNVENASEITDETIKDIETQIRNVIKENLDMTDEELDAALASMDLSVFQLLQPEVLQDFFMQQASAEPIDMITNAELIDTLQTLSQEIGQITENLDVETIQTFITESQTVSNPQTEIEPEVPDMQMRSVTDEVPTEKVQTNPTDTVQREDTVQDTQKEPSEQDVISVKEETTGIQVTVQGSGEKKEQGSHHSTEQQGQQFAGNVVNQLSQAVEQVTQTTTSYTSGLEQQDIVHQVIEQIKVWNSSENSRMQVQLYPEHLGRIEIQVMLKNGTMTAQITTETEMAKAAIESQLQLLKESFEEKSIQVDAVEVSVGTPDFNQEQERQDSTKKDTESGTHSKSIRLKGFADSEDELAEQDTEERLEAQGASVEFTA